MIRVLLVDDHPVVRDGLKGMLAGAGDLEVVGEAADGLQALACVSDLMPDVVLMDLRMPAMDGATATARLREVAPHVKVLVLTTYDSDGDIVRAVEAGAVGYLLKDAPADELHRAVRSAARGEPALSSAVAARLMAAAGAPRPEPLSDREREVLQLVAAGRTNRQVARQLQVSEATVKTHLVRTFAKLGVDDRTAAVTTALARGVIHLDGPQRG